MYRNMMTYRSGFRGRLGSVLSVGMMALMHTACLHVRGAHYRPEYDSQSETSFVVFDSYPSRENFDIVIRTRFCSLRALVRADESKNLNIYWDVSGCRRGFLCLQDGLLSVVDLETGKKRKVDVFYRRLGVGFDIEKTVDLSGLISGFSDVPVYGRDYSLSFSVSVELNGDLPETARIQVPDIQVGSRRIRLPSIWLRRGRKHELGIDAWDYVSTPEEGGPHAKREGVSIDYMGYLSKSYDLVYEEDSVFRVSARFEGSRSTWGGGEYVDSTIRGDVLFDVTGGSPVRLGGDRVAWRAPGDESERLVSIDNAQWQLLQYTTSSVKERIDGMRVYREAYAVFLDRSAHFFAVIPNYKAKKFRLEMPSFVDEEGRRQPPYLINLVHKPWRVDIRF